MQMHATNGNTKLLLTPCSMSVIFLSPKGSLIAAVNLKISIVDSILIIGIIAINNKIINDTNPNAFLITMHPAVIKSNPSFRYPPITGI